MLFTGSTVCGVTRDWESVGNSGAGDDGAKEGSCGGRFGGCFDGAEEGVEEGDSGYGVKGGIGGDGRRSLFC